jgi:uncharacterized protein (DUF2062 family)
MADLRGWLKRHIPSRETVGSYRLLRPFRNHLRRPDLWHFNQRSVPRAVALGLGVGVIIPFMHVVIAVILAIPARANVAVAGAFTLVVNPLTIPPMYYAAYRIGSWELRHDALGPDPVAAQEASSELGRMLFWLHHASGPIALGILTIAITAAATGYVVSALVWRLWADARTRKGGQHSTGPIDRAP